MKPYALQSAKRLDIPSQYQNNFAEFELAQWGHESGWGISSDSKGDDNFGGGECYKGILDATFGEAAQ